MKKTFLLPLTLVFSFVHWHSAAVKITRKSVKCRGDNRFAVSPLPHFVASDAMGGRDTPSHGLDITAEFLR